MRTLFSGRAYPKKNAASTLISRPMKVNVFGDIFDSARPLTIFCNSHPLPFPNALVQVKSLLRRPVDGGEFEDFEFALAVGRDNGGDVADLFAEQGAADGGSRGDKAFG